MFTWMRSLIGLVFGVVCWSFPLTLVAQSDPQAVESEHATDYAKLFRALDAQFTNHASVRSDLIKQRDEVQQGLLDSAADLQRIGASELVAQMRQIENQMSIGSLMEQVYRTPSTSTGRTSTHSRINQSVLATSLHQQQLLSLSLQNQWLQLDAAARLTLERRQKLLLSADAIAQKAQLWLVGDHKLFDQYMELADTSGIRSQPELIASVTALGDAAQDNLGAKLALAIGMLRLHNTHETKKILEEVLSSPTWVRPLALAIRGELAARTGDIATAKKILQEASRLAPSEPLVRLFRAQALSVHGDAKAATKEWELLLKTGKHEIAAHRGLALVHYSFFADQPRSQKLAMEHAELAVSLAAETDWSAQLSLALATAIKGDHEAAAELAEKAADCAMADKQLLCREIAAELKAGRNPKWKF